MSLNNQLSDTFCFREYAKSRNYLDLKVFLGICITTLTSVQKVNMDIIILTLIKSEGNNERND